MGLVYPAFLTRGEVKARVNAVEADGGAWLQDPDGTPLYPEDDRHRSEPARQQLISIGTRHAWRLDMEKAIGTLDRQLTWQETGNAAPTTIEADPAAWGDVVLSRSDAPSSYHLSVTADDAAQGITHVVRGLDLFHATSVHRLLQELLGLPQPLYHHHQLILDDDGRKLSKSARSTGLQALREGGALPADIRRRIGL